jgi:uncharacterized protein GlcG (DUF336 family)
MNVHASPLNPALRTAARRQRLRSIPLGAALLFALLASPPAGAVEALTMADQTSVPLSALPRTQRLGAVVAPAPEPLRSGPLAPACGAACLSAAGLEASRTLSADAVGQVIAQAVAQARAENAVATIAVVDRVGNVLGVYAMAGAQRDVRVASTAPGEPAIDGGLEGIVLPAANGGAALAAISKAITGAYLSSGGNAFSTRTASQIVQRHFNPGELNQPGGPLFGVQFSQLPCSDFMRRAGMAQAMTGPKRAPLGLSADPGGLPLYIDGVLVGGVGVSADGEYGLDPRITDFDRDLDERIALAAVQGLEAPVDILASRITVEGKVLRYVDARRGELASSVASARFAALGAADGGLLNVPNYGGGSLRAGTAFGLPESGLALAPSAEFGGLEAFVWVDALGAPRHVARAGAEASGALTPAEVRALIGEGLRIAARSRGQIRRPLGSTVRVSLTITDSLGNILGVARSRDAPVFGADVAVQKARSAALLSSAQAPAFFAALSEPTVLLDARLAPRRSIDLRGALAPLQSLLGGRALGEIAFSARAIGNLARPNFPDGIVSAAAGVLSAPAGQWSPFATGLQLDLVLNGIVQHVAHTAGLPGFAADTPANCVGVRLGSGASTAPGLQLANGLQIFPGGVPLYRGGQLVGAIGVSGDGIDQDDMVALLAADALGRSGGAGNAEAARRADTLVQNGVRLRYVQCPYAPFLDSNAQNVCAGK